MRKLFLAIICCLFPVFSTFAAPVQVTDILGRKVTVSVPAKRVVLTFNFEEYVAATGQEGLSKIVGWSRKYWQGRRQSTWDAFLKVFPGIKDIPDVGYIQKNTFNTEAVIALKPDVVFFAVNDFKLVSDELKRLENAGIPSVFVDYHVQTVKNHSDSTLLFGQIMGQQKRAGELVDYYVKNRVLVTDRIAKLSDRPRPKVYMEFSGDKSGPAVQGDSWGRLMWGAIISECGGDNIARDIVKGASGLVNPELVLSANPDVIIFAGNYAGEKAKNVGLGYEAKREDAITNLQRYSSRPGWSDLKAVKNSRLGALYHDLSRHIFDVAGMQFIAKMLYPDVFADLNPQKTLQEFYDRFFPIKLTGAFMVSLSE